MRGKVAVATKEDPPDRITPAYAGKSNLAKKEVKNFGDHPRLCGEKLKRQIESKQLKGSPPPMRGKADQIGIKNPEVGITPAYAGKSCHSPFPFDCSKDHPRLCGEKVFPSRYQRHFVRITPAYAGKSTWYRKGQRRFGDHPRLCGEKTKKIPKQRYFFHQSASFSFSLQYT